MCTRVELYISVRDSVYVYSSACVSVCMHLYDLSIYGIYIAPLHGNYSEAHDCVHNAEKLYAAFIYSVRIVQN